MRIHIGEPGWDRGILTQVDRNRLSRSDGSRLFHWLCLILDFVYLAHQFVHLHQLGGLLDVEVCAVHFFVVQRLIVITFVADVLQFLQIADEPVGFVRTAEVCCQFPLEADGEIGQVVIVYQVDARMLFALGAQGLVPRGLPGSLHPGVI